MRRVLRLVSLSIFFHAGASAAEDARPAIVYEGASYRDPFTASPEGKDKEKEAVRTQIGQMSFTLEGVLWKGTMPQAIVNGKIVTEGSRVGEAEVLEITQNGVKMRFKNQTFVLRPKGNQTS